MYRQQYNGVLEMTSSPSTSLSHNRGFTLIELVITVALMVIMLAIATPSFVSYRRNSELVSIANNFMAALNAARSEGMKRNMYAMVVPVNNDNDWSSGWVVFVDVNADGEYDSGDIVVLREEALPSYITVSGNGSTSETKSHVRYDGSGFSRPIGSLANATLSISRNDANSDFRQIRRVKIAVTGRARVCTPQSASDTNCSASGA